MNTRRRYFRPGPHNCHWCLETVPFDTLAEYWYDTICYHHTIEAVSSAEDWFVETQFDLLAAGIHFEDIHSGSPVEDIPKSGHYLPPDIEEAFLAVDIGGAENTFLFDLFRMEKA